MSRSSRSAEHLERRAFGIVSILLSAFLAILLTLQIKSGDYRRIIHRLEEDSGAVSAMPDTSDVVRLIGKPTDRTTRPTRNPKYRHFW